MAIIRIQPRWNSAGEGCFDVKLAEPLNVARLKDAIHAHDSSHRTVPGQQRLTFAGRPLQDISIYDGSVVELDSEFSLSVGSWHNGGWPGIDYFWQEVRASDTVASLKVKISAKTSIPCDEFFLTFEQDARLEDNCTLHSYNAQHRGCITVMPEQDCDQ